MSKKSNSVLTEPEIEEILRDFQETGDRLQESLDQAGATVEDWLATLPQVREEIVREKYPEFANTLRRQRAPCFSIQMCWSKESDPTGD